MEKEDLYMIKAVIDEYGAHAVLAAFEMALKECADEYSDLGLKERAHATIEVIELLAKLDDIE